MDQVFNVERLTDGGWQVVYTCGYAGEQGEYARKLMAERPDWTIRAVQVFEVREMRVPAAIERLKELLLPFGFVPMAGLIGGGSMWYVRFIGISKKLASVSVGRMFRVEEVASPVADWPMMVAHGVLRDALAIVAKGGV